jgi:hypothetical protein
MKSSKILKFLFSLTVFSVVFATCSAFGVDLLHAAYSSGTGLTLGNMLMLGVKESLDAENLNINGASVPVAKLGTNKYHPSTLANPLRTTSDLIQFNFYPSLNTVSVSIKSNSSATAAPKIVYLFNNDYMEDNGTLDNTTGQTSPGSIVLTYGDKRGGKRVSKQMEGDRDAMGAMIFGGSVRMRKIVAGVDTADTDGLDLCTPSLYTEDAFGVKVRNISLELKADEKRSDNDLSIQVFDTQFNFVNGSQMAITVPASDTATGVCTVTLYFKKR